MGKKKEELKQQLALARSNTEQLEQENQALRQQLTDAVAGPPFRLVTDGKPSPLRDQIAKALGIDPVSYAGVGLSDEMILEAVQRLTNPHLGDNGYEYKDALVVGKGDSLAEAIQHNKKERYDLDDALRLARGTIQRLAGALNVQQWNPDGDEIVEKAQRFGVFHHWLRKRLRALEATISEDDKRASAALIGGTPPAPIAVVEELRTILAALLAEKELAKFLQSKPVVASKTILDLAAEPAPSGNLYLDRPFMPEDVLWIRDAIKKIAGTSTARVGQLMLVFERMTRSSAATAEFCTLMNAVVLPVLRKQHPHYAAIPKEN